MLGAAGVLVGYQAATHWAATGVLPLLGAIPTKQRVVTDRNRITGCSVTAGIDFGRTVVARRWEKIMPICFSSGWNVILNHLLMQNRPTARLPTSSRKTKGFCIASRRRD